MNLPEERIKVRGVADTIIGFLSAADIATAAQVCQAWREAAARVAAAAPESIKFHSAAMMTLHRDTPTPEFIAQLPVVSCAGSVAARRCHLAALFARTPPLTVVEHRAEYCVDIDPRWAETPMSLIGYIFTRWLREGYLDWATMALEFAPPPIQSRTSSAEADSIFRYGIPELRRLWYQMPFINDASTFPAARCASPHCSCPRNWRRCRVSEQDWRDIQDFFGHRNPITGLRLMEGSPRPRNPHIAPILMAFMTVDESLLSMSSSWTKATKKWNIVLRHFGKLLRRRCSVEQIEVVRALIRRTPNIRQKDWWLQVIDVAIALCGK